MSILTICNQFVRLNIFLFSIFSISWIFIFILYYTIRYINTIIIIIMNLILYFFLFLIFPHIFIDFLFFLKNLIRREEIEVK